MNNNVLHTMFAGAGIALAINAVSVTKNFSEAGLTERFLACYATAIISCAALTRFHNADLVSSVIGGVAGTSIFAHFRENSSFMDKYKPKLRLPVLLSMGTVAAAVTSVIFGHYLSR